MDLTTNLKAGLRELRAQVSELQHKERIVEQAIKALGGENGRRATTAAPSPIKTVGKERFEKVEAYLRAHPNSRQSDIAKALEFNPGTIHSALHRLEEAGRVKRGERIKQDGSTSTMWHYTDDSRETVVHAGEGTKKGRRQTANTA